MIEFEGKTLYLQHQAYIDVNDDCEYYKAQAMDDDGVEYRVTWDIINTGSDNEDDACNWSNYEVSKQ